MKNLRNFILLEILIDLLSIIGKAKSMNDQYVQLIGNLFSLCLAKILAQTTVLIGVGLDENKFDIENSE